MKARDDYSNVPAPVPPLPREGVRSRDWDITNDVLIIAYLATTYALFLYWRRFEPGVSLQAAFFLLYSLATLGAFHLTRAMKAIPELLAVPIAVLGMLLYPFLTRWAGPWATSGLACLAVWGGVTAFPSLRQRASGWMLAAAGLGILVAFVQFYAVNIRNYAFIFGDVALESGTLFQDTLFH